MSHDSYTLRLHAPLDREVVRVYRGQINGARRALRTPDDGSVHSARKAVKRSRAMLRLIRGSLSEARFRQLDQGLRAAGRKMGSIRDAAVALSLVDTLKDEGVLPASVAADLHAFLNAAHAQAWDAVWEGDGIEGVRSDLQNLRLDLDDAAGMDVLTLYSGLAATYRSGHGRLAEAAQKRDAETLHAWRRQAKYVGYQLRLLVQAWPLVLRPTVRAFDALTDALGDDHDLSELIRRTQEADLGKKVRNAMTEMARTRGEALQATAWLLGARLYAEDAPRFAGRMAVYLATSLAETQQVPIHPLDGLAVPSPPNRPFSSRFVSV